jgi:AcrR family transcriptional regulator
MISPSCSLSNNFGKMYGGAGMDRRQKKTREAIFKAFIELMAKKDINKITVGEIIERADVGRATFYAHFETKDFLIKELCEELFDHIFEASVGDKDAHTHIFDCDAPDSVFLHLFRHLRKNDNNILQLLSCPNNDLFLRYFKAELVKLIKSQLEMFEQGRAEKLPEDFWLNHIAATFVETVRWWIDNGIIETEETITKYFFMAVNNK